MDKEIIITAIIIALNEQEFIDKCIQAVYPFVKRIYIVTNYDVDYYGNRLEPDKTIERITCFEDFDRKITILFNRNILDETIQRNWAMGSDESYYRSSHRAIFPHAHSLKEIRENTPRTDYYWIIDADEIYDPNTVPALLNYLQYSSADALLVRGYNFYKSWNYRFDLALDQFWQIGFLRCGKAFYSRRRLYTPKWLGLVWRVGRRFYEPILHLYNHEVKLPEEIAHFYHGSYIGSDTRISKKIKVSSHAKDLKYEEWYEKVWRYWRPGDEAAFPGNPSVTYRLDYLKTNDLPAIIRTGVWPEGWIES